MVLMEKDYAQAKMVYSYCSVFLNRVSSDYFWGIWKYFVICMDPFSLQLQVKANQTRCVPHQVCSQLTFRYFKETLIQTFTIFISRCLFHAVYISLSDIATVTKEVEQWIQDRCIMPFHSKKSYLINLGSVCLDFLQLTSTCPWNVSLYLH